MHGTDLIKLLLASSLCLVPAISEANTQTPPHLTLIINQPSDTRANDVVDTIRVCMQGNYAVVYHDELDRYGNATHPPPVFNVEAQCWWDSDKCRWITKSDWTKELEKAKGLATKKFNAQKDLKDKEFLLWSLEPVYTIEVRGESVQLSSAWLKHSVTRQGKVTKEKLASLFGFRRLMLARNSIEQKKGFPFIHTAADNALFEAGVLPMRVTTSIHVGSLNSSTWTEYEFRDSTPNEISESASIIASLPPLH